MSSQNLMNVYEKQDTKLVYQKYVEKGDWEMKTSVYASYLVNVVNLVKNENPKIQYQPNMEAVEKIAEAPEQKLKFDSLFESGNLYAAFQVQRYSGIANISFR